MRIPIKVCALCSRKIGDDGENPLASAGFLNQEAHKEHEDCSFLRVLRDLRGSFF